MLACVKGAEFRGTELDTNAQYVKSFIKKFDSSFHDRIPTETNLYGFGLRVNIKTETTTKYAPIIVVQFGSSANTIDTSKLVTELTISALLDSQDYSTKTWPAFETARINAQRLLDSLFDEKGNPTDANQAEYQDDADGVAEELTRARLALDHRVDSIAQKSSENFIAGIRRYAALYDPEKLSENDFAFGWSTFLEARTKALSVLENNGRFYTGMGINELLEQYQAFSAFRNACVKLEQKKGAGETVSALVSVSDPYALRKGQDSVYDATQRLSFASGTTLSQLLTQMEIPAFSPAWDRDYAVYLNGDLFFDVDFVISGSYADDAYGDMLLRDGDEVVIARIAPPIAQDSSQMSSSAVQLQDASQYIRYQRITPSKTTVTVGESFTITVEATAAMPGDYTGEYNVVKGASVFASAAATDIENAGKNKVDNNLLVKTGADGTATVTLYEEGWVLLNAFDLDSEYGSLTNGAAVFIKVEASDDLAGVLTELKDALNAAAADAAYPKNYFLATDWTALQTALTDGLNAIDAAADSGAARSAQLAAMQTITDLQKKADKYNAENLAAFYENLNKLPADLDMLDAGAQSIVDALIAAYEAMTEYQLQQLSAKELETYNTVKAKAEAGLDAATVYSLTVAFDLSGVPDADKSGLEAMIAYLRNNVQTEGKRDVMGGNRMGGLYSFNTVKTGNYSSSVFTPVTSAIPGTTISFISSPEYATHTLIRGKRNVDVNGTEYGNTGYTYTISDGDWTITDTTASYGLQSMDTYYKVLYPGRTYTVNGNAYEMRGVSFEGLDEDVVSQTGYKFYDFSDYFGPSGTYTFLLYPDSALTFTMPYNDVTITVQWAPVSGTISEIDRAKEAARDSINNAWSAYDREKYSDANYAKLTAAKDTGLTEVESAATLDAVNQARQSALAALAAVKADLDGTGPVAGLPDYGDVIGKVYVSFENNKFPGGSFTGTILSGWYDLCQQDTMMTAVLKALATEGFDWTGTGSLSGNKYEITYLSSISKDGKKLAEFDGDSGSGWMGTLNDWFVNEGFNMFTVADGKLGNGDIISIQYTQNLGVDLGGTWTNSDTSLKDLVVVGGTLIPTFAGNTTGYTLMIPTESASIQVAPTAANKNYLVKNFLNIYNSDAAFYKRTEPIFVRSGDMIYIGVGEKEWPSMNQFGDHAREYTATKYSLHVVYVDDGADYVNKQIAALPEPTNVNNSNYVAVKKQISNIDAVIAELPDSEQAKVNTEKLDSVREVVEGFANVQELKAEIAALPKVIEETAEVSTALEKYDALKKAGLNSLLTMAEINKIELAAELLDILAQVDDTMGFNTSKAYDKGALNEALVKLLNDMKIADSVSVSVDSYNGAVSGKEGNDGSYSATVTLKKGNGTAKKTVSGAITRSSDTGVSEIVVNKATRATGSGTAWSAVMPYGSDPAAAQFSVTLSDKTAEASAPATADSGKTWTFTVTAEDGSAADYTVTLTISEVKVAVLDSNVYDVSDDMVVTSLSPVGVSGLDAIVADDLDLPVGTKEASVWLMLKIKEQSDDELTLTVTAWYAADGKDAEKISDVKLKDVKLTVTVPLAGTEYAKVRFGSEYLKDTKGSTDGIEFPVTAAGDYTLIPDASLVKVTFHLNGGTSTAVTDGQQIVYFPEDVNKDLPLATREGDYSFEGWFKSADGSGVVYTKISADLPTDLYAVWKSLEEDVEVIEYIDKKKVSVDSVLEDDGTAVVTVKSAEPCVVILKNGDSYVPLKAVKDGDSYVFSQKDYKDSMVFIVAAKGDFDKDGDLDADDFTAANLAILGQKDVEPLQLLVMGANGKKLKTVDLAKLYLALATSKVEW